MGRSAGPQPGGLRSIPVLPSPASTAITHRLSPGLSRGGGTLLPGSSTAHIEPFTPEPSTSCFPGPLDKNPKSSQWPTRMVRPVSSFVFPPASIPLPLTPLVASLLPICHLHSCLRTCCFLLWTPRSLSAWPLLTPQASGQRSPPLSPCLQSFDSFDCSLQSPYFICVTASYHLIPGVHMVKLQERGSLSVSFRPWNRPWASKSGLLLSC